MLDEIVIWEDESVWCFCSNKRTIIYKEDIKDYEDRKEFLNAIRELFKISRRYSQEGGEK